MLTPCKQHRHNRHRNSLHAVPRAPAEALSELSRDAPGTVGHDPAQHVEGGEAGPRTRRVVGGYWNGMVTGCNAPPPPSSSFLDFFSFSYEIHLKEEHSAAPA